MTRNIIKILVVLCIVAIFMVLNVLVIQPIKAKNDINEEDYKYHFQVLLEKNERDKSNEDFRKNLIAKGKENNIFVEIIEIENKDSKKALVEQGIYSKVDGIACSIESKKIGDLLYKKAKNNKIALINYGMNPYEYEEMLSIGIDECQLANRTVNEICDLTDKEDKILVFLNHETSKNRASNKQIIKEFKKEIKNNKRNIENIKFVKINKDKFQVSSYIKETLEDYKDYDGIVSLDSKYSSIIGNIISNKEISKLSDKVVVAYGENKDNKSYLKKGIVDTIITSDGADMADKLIATMIDIKAGAKLRNYITNITVIKRIDGKIKYETHEVNVSK